MPPRSIEIINAEYLNMAAGNLAIVQNTQGEAVRPGLWIGCPQVPDYLLEVQDILEQTR